MQKTRLVKVILILLLMIYPVSASAGDEGSWMVKNGFELFGKSIGDSFYEMGTGNKTVNQSESSGLLVRLISYTIDPYSFDFVMEWQKITIVSYVLLAILSLLIASSRMAQGKISYHQMTSNVLLGCVLPVAVLFGTYLILQINYVVSAFLSSQGLNAIPISGSNIVAYFIMAITFFIMSIVMFARNVIIIFFAAGGIVLAALYFIPHMKDAIESAYKYFLVIVFMQPILIFITILGMSFLQALPSEILQFQAIGSIVLGLLIMVLGVSLLLGKGIVRLFMYRAVLRR